MTDDRFFNGHRVPRTEKAWLAVRQVTSSIDAYEKHLNPKKRRRRPADQATFENTIAALVCDLMQYVLLDGEQNFVVPRSKRVLGKRDRYTPTALNQKLPEWLDALTELGWIAQQRGHGRLFGPNQRTIIAPLEPFIDLMEGLNIELSDIGRSKGEEIIILKAPKEKHNKKPTLIPYPDTEQTIQWRKELTRINEWLAAADIEFDERVLKGFEPIDTEQRQLRRSFSNASFNQGGRLGGGFWMNLGKDERLNGLRINGERVVSLDYGQSAHRIAYGLAGMKPPDGDLYAIPGIDSKYRDGVKLLMSAMLFSDGIPKSKPKGSAKLLPKNMTAGELCRLIISAHPQMKHFYPSQRGYEIQFIESEILLSALTLLMDQGVVSLPVHDCVIVPESQQELAQEVMLRVFAEKAHTEGSVSIDRFMTVVINPSQPCSLCENIVRK